MIGWVSLRASVASSVRLSSTSRLSPPSCACTNFLVFLCSISRASAMASFEEEDDDAQFRAEMCRRGRSDEEEMERRRAARASAMEDDDDDDTRFDEETERRRAWANALARAQASISGDDDATLRGDRQCAKQPGTSRPAAHAKPHAPGRAARHVRSEWPLAHATRTPVLVRLRVRAIPVVCGVLVQYRFLKLLY